MTTIYVPYKGVSGDSDLKSTGFSDGFAVNMVTSGYSSQNNNWTVANGATQKSSCWTEAGEPGVNGATGDFSIKYNITTGNVELYISVQIHRVNSAGTIQNSSAVTAEQQATAGIKTFTFSAQSLGTWAAGDRLRVDFIARSVGTMGGQSHSVGHGTTDAAVTTPFGAVPAATHQMFALF